MFVNDLDFLLCCSHYNSLPFSSGKVLIKFVGLRYLCTIGENKIRED